ncbi:MarR family winged helix-turn-helix transcriptional regulator [Streptomyces sp. NPDC005474]|uniref:MarR family winged helix-turn-helix transcriptional regulator n=1 Tax=Streptomyces sp. NPDC005474 TaxID=3154878 RepID=UPI003451AF0D
MDEELRALVSDERVVFWGRVVNLHRALNTLLHADIRAATGLDGTEFEFLLRLSRFPGPRAHASKVAATMCFSSAGTTKLVARLEAKGIIDRVRDPQDGRAFQVALTDAGEAALRAGLKAHIPRLEAEVATRLTAAQRRQLQDLLSRIDPGEASAVSRPDSQ